MRLLFVCVGNSCRSQMAEAIARHLGHEAESAGTHPADRVSTNAITVLNEMGISTDGLYPKLVKDIVLNNQTIISMGCGVSCPTIRIDEDWGLEDPVGQPIEMFRQTAEVIKRKIINLQ